MAANSFQDSQSLHEPSIVVKMLQSLVYGLGAAIVWGLLFGLLSRITVLLGIIGSVGLGFVTAAMVLMPFKQLGRAHALILFPVSFVLTLVGTGLIILIPFVLVTLAVDSKATLQVAIALAWDF